MSAARHLVWQDAVVDRDERRRRNGHRGGVVWFTGLSGAGKTTLAQALERRLFDAGCQVATLDGDNVRHGLCRDLGFSEADRHENIRRVGEVARLFAGNGQIAITAFISPYAGDRDAVRQMFAAGEFFEVHVDCPLAVCEQRDVKGHYRRARAGEIAGYTGVDSPYEPPSRPELVLKTAELAVDACVDRIHGMLAGAGVLAGRA